MKNVFKSAFNATIKFTHTDESVKLTNRLWSALLEAKKDNDVAKIAKIEACLNVLATNEKKAFASLMGVSLLTGIAIHYLPLAFIFKLLLAIVSGTAVGITTVKYANKYNNIAINQALASL
jgi:hypothetical protein